MSARKPARWRIYKCRRHDTCGWRIELCADSDSPWFFDSGAEALAAFARGGR